MPRDQLTFRRRDLKAALQAAKEAGLSVASIKVCKDGAVVVVGEPAPAPADPGIDTDDGTLTDEHVRDAEI
jgi:hypothetical protein